MKRQPRILITRSPHQASELADRLRALGVEPVLIPTIETVEPTSYSSLDETIAVLTDPAAPKPFHWLLFTSANAVEAFQRRLLGAQITCGLRVAAIGPATARSLDAAGLSADLVPLQAVAESLAESLLPYALQPDGTPTHFLLVRAEQAREHLPETLRAAGAEVTVAAAYRTVIPAGSVEAIRGLFAEEDAYPDAITFTSSSSVLNLLALLSEAGLALPPDVLRVSIGPITSKTLREAGLAPHAEAAEATVEALAQACRSLL